MSAKPNWKRMLPALIMGFAMVTCTGSAIYFLRDFLGTKAEPPKKLVQEVRIIRPPPPPPEVEPPPPPPPEEEVDLPKPDPTPSDEPAPGDQLGVDAAGTGAGDGFGLVGRPGGRDLLASGGSAFAWYGGLIKNQILDLLGDDKKARSGSYSVVVRLWVRHDGTVEKANLMGSTGNTERDLAISRALAQLTRVSQAPPADMPQPISLRIVSRA
jgi:periplasmic protein TonB